MLQDVAVKFGLFKLASFFMFLVSLLMFFSVFIHFWFDYAHCRRARRKDDI